MPEAERTFVISYDASPASLNAGGAGSRRHWGAAHREKEKWMGIYTMLLLAAKVPAHMERVVVSAQLEFTTKARRDSENYRPSISKPLADTLVRGRWLPDDTDEYFRFDRVEIIGRKLEHPNPAVKGRITVALEAVYAW